jgi:hypothetical protein
VGIWFSNWRIRSGGNTSCIFCHCRTGRGRCGQLARHRCGWSLAERIAVRHPARERPSARSRLAASRRSRRRIESLAYASGWCGIGHRSRGAELRRNATEGVPYCEEYYSLALRTCGGCFFMAGRRPAPRQEIKRLCQAMVSVVGQGGDFGRWSFSVPGTYCRPFSLIAGI